MKKLILLVTIVIITTFGIGFVISSTLKKTAQDSELTIPSSVPSEITSNSQPSAQEGQIQSSEITLTVISPADGATVTNPTLTVRGSTVPGAEVFINDLETVADASGNFSVRLTLDEGENPVVIFANDADGNTAETYLTVTYNSGR